MADNDREVEKILKDCANLFFRKNDSSSPNSHTIPNQVGRYTIEAELGRGSMGKVMKAHDPTLGRKVAVKMLSPEIATDTENLERFKREAKCIANLRHPCIVSLYDFLEIADSYFLVMQFIDGCSLERRMQQKLPIPKICRWIVQILGAIGYSHRNKIIHRDMKPSNILVDRQENVFLTDFGIAKSFQEETRSLSRPGIILGTPLYMSPEQTQGMAGNLLDGRTDIYSIGVVFYEMLTGRQPFLDNDISKLIYKIIHDQVPTPKSLEPSIPDELDRICMKALQKDRAQRYATAEQMSAEIREYLRSTDPKSSNGKECPAEITQKQYPNRRVLTMGGMLFLATVACIFLLFGNPQPDRPPAETGDPAKKGESPKTPEAGLPAETWENDRKDRDKPERKSPTGNRNETGRDKKRLVRYLMKEMDMDHDNRISKTEWKYTPELFDKVDMNHDGFLTPPEVEVRSKELEKACQVRPPKK